MIFSKDGYQELNLSFIIKSKRLNVEISSLGIGTTSTTKKLENCVIETRYWNEERYVENDTFGEKKMNKMDEWCPA